MGSKKTHISVSENNEEESTKENNSTTIINDSELKINEEHYLKVKLVIGY